MGWIRGLDEEELRVTSTLAHRRRQWHPTPVLLLGKSHGWRSLVGCSPWGHSEPDMTEKLHFQFSLCTFMHWSRKWQPTPVFLPGESQGQRSLVGCHLWGCTVGQLKQLSCSSRCGLRSLLQVGTLGWQRRENLKTNFIHLSTFLQALTLKRASLVAWW